MTLEQFLTLLATTFGAIGSIYVLKSILRLSPEIIERLSATYFGHNLNHIDSLSEQKSESIIGTGLIAIALLIAIINAITTPAAIIVHKNRFYAFLFCAIISIVFWLILYTFGNKIKNQHMRAAACIIVARNLDRLFKEKKPIPKYELKSLQNLNERYFHIEKSSEESPRDFLRHLSMEVGCSFPEDIQIED